MHWEGHFFCFLGFVFTPKFTSDKNTTTSNNYSLLKTIFFLALVNESTSIWAWYNWKLPPDRCNTVLKSPDSYWEWNESDVEKDYIIISANGRRESYILLGVAGKIMSESNTEGILLIARVNGSIFLVVLNARTDRAKSQKKECKAAMLQLLMIVHLAVASVQPVLDIW